MIKQKLNIKQRRRSFQVVLVVKSLPASAGDIRVASSNPGLGRSPGEGLGNPLQYSCLENPMDRGAWRAILCRVTKSQTWLKRLSMHAWNWLSQNQTICLNFMSPMCSVQFSSVAQSCPTLCDPIDCSTPGLPVHHQLLEFTQTHVHWSVMTSNHLIFCHPLLLLPLVPPSIRVFSNESTLRMRRPKDWSFSFSIIPSKEIPGLISFRMDWLDLLAVQRTLKSVLQHHSSKASISLVLSFLYSPTLTSIHDHRKNHSLD